MKYENILKKLKDKKEQFKSLPENKKIMAVIISVVILFIVGIGGGIAYRSNQERTQNQKIEEGREQVKGEVKESKKKPTEERKKLVIEKIDYQVTGDREYYTIVIKLKNPNKYYAVNEGKMITTIYDNNDNVLDTDSSGQFFYLLPQESIYIVVDSLKGQGKSIKTPPKIQFVNLDWENMLDIDWGDSDIKSVYDNFLEEFYKKFEIIVAQWNFYPDIKKYGFDFGGDLTGQVKVSEKVINISDIKITALFYGDNNELLDTAYTFKGGFGEEKPQANSIYDFSISTASQIGAEIDRNKDKIIIQARPRFY